MFRYGGQAVSLPPYCFFGVAIEGRPTDPLGLAERPVVGRDALACAHAVADVADVAMEGDHVF